MSAPTTSDANLWLAYGTKLKDTLTAGQLGPNDYFFIAPPTYAGIAADPDPNKIPTSITNWAVFNIGDTLLDVRSPIFNPGTGSYFSFVRDYLLSVRLPGDNEAGARYKLKIDQEQLGIDTGKFQDADDKAFAAYKKDQDRGGAPASYQQWLASGAYPPYQVGLEAMKSTANKVSQDTKDIGGDLATDLGDAIQATTSAKNTLNPATGYNLPCSTATANIIREGAAKEGPVFYQPQYTLPAQYPSDVSNWIMNFNKKVTKVEFSVKDSETTKWEDLGFDSREISVSGSYAIFFTATFTDEESTKTVSINASEAASELQASITYSGIGVYDVTPGVWNVKNLKDFPLKPDANPSLMQPVCRATKVVMGYGVGISIQMSGSLKTQVHDYMEKAKKTQGSAKFFGFDVGLGAGYSGTSTSTTSWDDVKSNEDGTKIEIPPQNNAYPTLLGVFGSLIDVAPLAN